ncbi:MAG TPA: DNA-protecting protein DprA [Candidatus Pacebacteria bacterium]|nr:MAG: protecting protein dpra protein [Microgenomates group bacterium GW2011_GWB1_45_17]KKU24215.1 MAG: protecting protein dpra protein [Microgenomates group bacterium GW2011_GWC1_46_15]KKU24931.1 MAG: protecting protein dpra protein [Microgenomates group bacterium GW2011_GWA1_46_15]HAV15326.1 DNA-protecting protein DprA [Candidatus Paceibacterota bacterium]HCR11402.1 DNA-protecting protein DprA [Candidatus Paceibacterota bacterium]
MLVANEWYVASGSREYPALLVPLNDHPRRLFWQGAHPSSFPKPIAVIGTRNMTAYGAYATDYFVRGLIACGFCIVSGLALGVDGRAHEAALKYGGKTIGVLAGGLNQIQPATHIPLAQKIISFGGTLVSEFPRGTPPLKHRFRRRNRIIAGLSLGVLVIEAGERSGTHITAGFAAEYGRSVFAVSGPITSPYADGIKALVNTGAKLVTTVQDILEDLPVEYTTISAEKTADQNREQQRLFTGTQQANPKARIVEIIQQSTLIDIDAIVEQSTLSLSEVQRFVGELELEGIIDRVSGGQYMMRGR